MIEVQGLTRYYGRTPAVRDVTFRIERKEIVGFLGLNGAGKTTTLKVLAGLLMPSAGRVLVDGVDATEDPEALRRRIGFLPEDPPLHPEMRVRDFLAWCGAIRGMTPDEVASRLDRVMTLCDITDVQHRLIDELSHGYRKRVGIAQAIVHGPELVILDEPISGLDPVQIVGMRKVILDLKEECTVLLSSHILAEVSQVCDRILVLGEGRLVAQGTPAELSRRLEGGGRLRLVLRGDGRAVEEVLAAQEAVARHEVSVHDGLVHAEVDLQSDAVEAVVSALVAAGIGVRRVEDAEAELEEIFLRLTRTRDAAA